jgi:two-component system, sensor histidine kinase YesM
VIARRATIGRVGLPRASVRARLVAVLTGFVAVVFLFAALLFLLHEQRSMRLTYAMLYETLAASSRAMDRALEDVERKSVDIMADSVVQEGMRVLAETPDGYPWHREAQSLVGELRSYGRLPDIPAIACIDARGRAAITRNDFPPLDAILDPAALASFRGSVLPVRWIYTDATNRYLFLLRRIREVRGLSLRDLGTVVIVVEKAPFIDRMVLHPFRDDLGLAVLSGTTVVYRAGGAAGLPPDLPGAGTRPYDVVTEAGRRWFLAQIAPAGRPLRYVYLLPYERLFSSLGRFRRLLVAFAAVLFAVMVGFSFWIAGSVTKPIARLAGLMRSAEAGRLSRIRLEERSRDRHDEIGELYREFGTMLGRIDRLIHERYRTQLVLKEAEFRSLQAQINPHFLYNTLESINWLAQLGRAGDIAEMVQALGAILRASIDRAAPLVRLGEELSLLRSYVLIQRARYGPRLRVDIEVPDDCGDVAIPKLTLQPLVENAIKYGLGRSSRQCRVAVSAAGDGDKVRVVVRDNGPGMSEDLVRRLLRGKSASRGSGVGIKNIDERLRSIYGSRGGLSIESRPRRGTTITITLPRRRTARPSAGRTAGR